MNETNHQLDRLLKAAARAPQGEVAPASFAMETRVMAAWRVGRSGEDVMALISWFRRAVACGCLVMVVSLAWGYSISSSQTDTANNSNEPISIADSALTMALNQ
ncbi:MAG: hypothetical protein JWQ71_1601 [Pedosphaera sp.]|nr:hypothetical protein [Pedosphaera sp.]